MAIHSSDSLTYYAALPEAHLERLGSIRHWSNVKVGFAEGKVWLKGLTDHQIRSVAFKSIPYKQVFYASGERLFPLGHLLPSSQRPPLIWFPIEDGLPLARPAYNHHFFGLHDKIKICLVPALIESPIAALLIQFSELKGYMEAAPAVRLKGLHWVIIDNENALVVGTPLLPLQGAAFWRRGDLLMPAGYDFAFPVLSQTLLSLLNPYGEDLLLWSQKGTYRQINKQAFQPLSISSFRRSLKHTYGSA